MARRKLPAALVARVRQQAQGRCGYCLSPQSLVHASLEIEHLIPVSKGGSDAEQNLWLSCPLCNAHKGSRTSFGDPQTGAEYPLFNPRTQVWNEHFK